MSGEDPFLGYTMIQPAVKGIQSQGVVANAKHWVMNSQETHRGDIDEVVDERTRFEMFYPPFEGAIDAGVGSFMCSYNKINGRWSCENDDTLRVDLKERLGFDGWVMSDWGATHSTSINQGLDQEMPGADFMGASLKAAVTAGNVTMDAINDSVVRILWPLFAVGAFDKANNNTIENNVTCPEHDLVARKVSAASHVLLKNDGVLPLSKTAKMTVALIGLGATKSALYHGGGSGQVDAGSNFVAPVDGLTAVFGGVTPPPCASCATTLYETGIDYLQTSNPSSAAKDVDDCCKQCQGRTDCAAFSFKSGRSNTLWLRCACVDMMHGRGVLTMHVTLMWMNGGGRHMLVQGRPEWSQVRLDCCVWGAS